MFFRGAQFRRDGHERCTLLPFHNLPSICDSLTPVWVISPTETLLTSFQTCTVTHFRQGQVQQILQPTRQDPGTMPWETNRIVSPRRIQKGLVRVRASE
jgi:hypothetical protein